MKYTQLTTDERYLLSAFAAQKLSCAAIALRLGRHRSTIYREFSRNGQGLRKDYHAARAVVRAVTRRISCNQERGFASEQFAVVEDLIRQQWSPEQVSGYLGTRENFWISHETIYRHIWRNKRAGGDLRTHLRCAKRQRRKRYGSYPNRSQPPDRRNIAERPTYANTLNDRPRKRHGFKTPAEDLDASR